MITSFITPSKRRMSAELEEMFQRHCVAGHEPKRFAPGESGGRVKFEAGSAAKAAARKAAGLAAKGSGNNNGARDAREGVR